MGLIYGEAGPSCFVSPDVRVLPNREHDIPHTGPCVGVVVRADCDASGCDFLGILFDSKTTLYVDQLHDAGDVEAFKAICRRNNLNVHDLAGPGGGLCPPPPNQAQVEEWRKVLFQKFRPR